MRPPSRLCAAARIGERFGARRSGSRSPMPTVRRLTDEERPSERQSGGCGLFQMALFKLCKRWCLCSKHLCKRTHLMKLTPTKLSSSACSTPDLLAPPVCLPFWCWPAWAGILISLVIGALPSMREFGFGFFTSSNWDTVQGPIWRTRAHLRHFGYLGHRLADCRAGELRHCPCSHRIVPGIFAPAAGHCGGSF